MHFLNVSTEIVSAPAVATMDAPQVFSLLQLDTLPVSMFAIAIDGAVLLVLLISTEPYLHTRQSRVASQEGSTTGEKLMVPKVTFH